MHVVHLLATGACAFIEFQCVDNPHGFDMAAIFYFLTWLILLSGVKRVTFSSEYITIANLLHFGLHVHSCNNISQRAERKMCMGRDKRVYSSNNSDPSWTCIHELLLLLQ